MNLIFKSAFFMIFILSSFGQGHNDTRSRAMSASEQLKKFKVPEGFVVELVASEEHGVVNPIDIAFDDSGRLWTQTASMYPLDPADLGWRALIKLMEDTEAQEKHPEFKRIKDLYTGKTKGKDKILIIENLYKPQRAKVFADGLAIPQSILPYKNGVFVAHGYQMIYLNDKNKDGKADDRKVVLEGFGFTDTHTMAHSLIRAPGSYVYFSHGALNKGLVTAKASGRQTRIDYQKNVRFSLDGKKLEVVSSGMNNNWGINLRGKGQWYGSEANDGGWSVVPFEDGTGITGIGKDRMRPYQPWFPPIHSFRVGGTGLSGCAFSDDLKGGFPEKYRDVAFLANPITRKLNAVRVSRNPDGTTQSEHLPDFLTCDDEWFRPVNVEFGPDGCLYIVDWYNRIISHNEVSRESPKRDKRHGRIWRVRHKNQVKKRPVNFARLSTSKLVKALKASGTIWAKRAAWHQIADRRATKLIPELKQVCRDSNVDETTRIIALWSLESLRHYDQALMTELISKTSPWELRREAVRALANMKVSADDVASHLESLIEDDNVMIRSQALRTINNLGKANAKLIEILVSYCRPELPGGETLGGPYERKFERYLARKALENYPLQLDSFLKSRKAKEQPESNIEWASKALSGDSLVQNFLSSWKENPNSKINEDNIVAISNMLGKPQVFAAVKSAFADKNNSVNILRAAVKHKASINSKRLSKLLKPSVYNVARSKKIENLNLAFDAASQYRITGLDKFATKVLGKTKDDELALNCLRYLEGRSKKSLSTFTKVFDASESFVVKKKILEIMSKLSSKETAKSLVAYLPQVSAGEKLDLIHVVSSRKNGSNALLSAFDEGQLKQEDFDRFTLKRIKEFYSKDERYVGLDEFVLEQEVAQTKALEESIAKYTKLIEANSGTAEKGEPLFEAMCLSCHKVGEQGPGIAPPLDGSAHRSNEGLLTAILAPSLAVEGSYNLYTVIKKDGSSIDGYKEKHNNEGVTLRFMGGAKHFIPSAQVQEAYFKDRSFMPDGLISGLSEQQFSDLVAYIKTLK